MHKAQQTSLNHSLAGGLKSIPHSPKEEEDRAQALLDLSISLVDSAIDILENHIKSDRQLVHDSKLMPGGTPGKHFRHVLEMFRAFLLPLQPYSSTPPRGPLTINYDAILPSSRRPLARSLPACRKAMVSIRADLQAWGDRARAGRTSLPASYGHDDDSKGLSRPIRTMVEDGGVNGVGSGLPGEVGLDGLAGELRREVTLVAVTPTRQEVKSSVGRELWFCALHAIHHFSMLRTIAVHELGLELPVEFGTAPSTLLYRDKNRTTSAQNPSRSAARTKAKL